MLAARGLATREPVDWHVAEQLAARPRSDLNRRTVKGSMKGVFVEFRLQAEVAPSRLLHLCRENTPLRRPRGWS